MVVVDLSIRAAAVDVVARLGRNIARSDLKGDLTKAEWNRIRRSIQTYAERNSIRLRSRTRLMYDVTDGTLVIWAVRSKVVYELDSPYVWERLTR